MDQEIPLRLHAGNVEPSMVQQLPSTQVILRTTYLQKNKFTCTLTTNVRVDEQQEFPPEETQPDQLLQTAEGDQRTRTVLTRHVHHWKSDRVDQQGLRSSSHRNFPSLLVYYNVIDHFINPLNEKIILIIRRLRYVEF